MSKMKIIDLFSGAGGLSYGFAHDDFFEIVAAVEILPDMAKTYKENHKNTKVYNIDISNFNKTLFSKDFVNTKIDMVIGGPPCQAYSTIGKRLLDDPRGKLFQEYYRILAEFKPKFFIFENVKGLLSMDGGNLLNTIIMLFSKLGYNVKYKLINAADYGVPQIRERVIITGTLKTKNYNYPTQTHTNEMGLFSNDLKLWITMEDALSDLELIENGSVSKIYQKKPQNEYQKYLRSSNTKEILDHDSSKNGEHLLEMMRHLPQGGTLKDIPASIRPLKAFPNSYSRLWWKRPSTTITRNLGTPSSARCIHPLVDRGLTTREGARLQSFPDDYIFTGSRSSKNLQIGNSVPPLLSIHLAKSVKEYFTS